MTLPILLLGLGLVLILAEILFPSFGILSVLATVSVVASIALAFQESSTMGLTFLVVTALLVPFVIVGGMRIFPKSPVGKLMVLDGLSFDSQAGVDSSLGALLGQQGTLDADCRPAGIAHFEGRRVDVVTRGEWVTSGSRVEVVEVQGNRVIVRGLETPPATET
jgi:membrane-bound serine protease (ClpP class)